MSVSYREPLETVGKRMVVTGPDYIKDHLPKVHQHTAYIGEKRPALEKTGDLRYLLRSTPNRSLPAKYKYEYVGEIGWGIPEYCFINRSRLGSGFHIKLGELSLYATDKLTHRYQNPWQPKPSVLDKQGEYSRAFLAWNMSDYEDTQQRDSQRAILVKQSKSPRPSLPSRLPKLPRKEEKRQRSTVRELRRYCSPEIWAPMHGYKGEPQSYQIREGEAPLESKPCPAERTQQKLLICPVCKEGFSY